MKKLHILLMLLLSILTATSLNAQVDGKIVIDSVQDGTSIKIVLRNSSNRAYFMNLNELMIMDTSLSYFQSNYDVLSSFLIISNREIDKVNLMRCSTNERLVVQEHYFKNFVNIPAQDTACIEIILNYKLTTDKQFLLFQAHYFEIKKQKAFIAKEDYSSNIILKYVDMKNTSNNDTIRKSTNSMERSLIIKKLHQNKYNGVRVLSSK